MNRRFSLKAGRPAAGAFVLALGVLSGAAQAALFGDDEARRAILELRQKQEQARTENAERGNRLAEQMEQMRRSLLELNNQLELTRGEIARLRGQNEQLARDLSEVQRRQTDLARGMDDRLQKIEPQRVSVDGREILVMPDERREYETALETFRKGDFTNAAAAFAAFQRRFPNSGYAPSVSYWLGNAFYGKRDYREALAEFRNLVAVAPNHPRVPEALLSIAMCQIELKDRPAARKTLDDLIKAHPQSEAAKEAKDRLVSLR
ncbi:tol-pal system protein YbgF [Caldimonas tepidiphila]|uniref:tol-pal system protein YbgF n=1 Tax=Caldimonas tepidiphila TaxID=2315841 RepID=UPI000E5BFE84|nr:tol-pal system protein YbgF [Caldimonas tepidiphila]